MKVSEERLRELAFSAGLEPCDSDPVYDGLMVGEVVAMAKELLALRKAFSEPFCFTDDAGVSLRSHKSNFECSPVKFGNKDIPLFRKPTPHE